MLVAAGLRYSLLAAAALLVVGPRRLYWGATGAVGLTRSVVLQPLKELAASLGGDAAEAKVAAKAAETAVVTGKEGGGWVPWDWLKGSQIYKVSLVVGAALFNSSLTLSVEFIVAASTTRFVSTRTNDVETPRHLFRPRVSDCDRRMELVRAPWVSRWM